MEIRVTYRPSRETAWNQARQYTDRMKGGRCYRDRASGGLLRWFLPYSDDDLTVLYEIDGDGSTWCERESGCYAGSHMLTCAGIPEEDVEEISIEDFKAGVSRLLKEGGCMETADNQEVRYGER